MRSIGAKGAILIAQLFHWKGKQRDPDGWIYKTKHELEDETGLTRWEQDTCTAELKKHGILETRYERLDHRLYYRINQDTLDRIMETDSPGESGKPAFGKAGKPLSPKRKVISRESVKSAFVNNQEITTETTSKKTTTTATASNGSHPVVVVVSLASAEEDPREAADKLIEEFGPFNSKQSRFIQDYIDKDPGYVIRQAEIVRSEPRDNAARSFMAALRDDWQKAKRITKSKQAKEKPRPVQEEFSEMTEEQIARNKVELASLKASLKAELRK